MEYKSPLLSTSTPTIQPRLIIHGGAGNIRPSNLPPAKYKSYHQSLLSVITQAHHFLTTPPRFPLSSPDSQSKSTSALDAVTFAVTLLEDNPLFNAGHGAVFTRDGINELETSIMVSRGKKKRGVGLMGLRHVKNPIKLAREMLLHGEKDLENPNGEHRGPMSSSTSNITDTSKTYPSLLSGAQGHCQLHKYSAEALAKQWGLELVDPSYFFVQARWDEHISGLENEKNNTGCATWDAEQFFPQGTVGAVALDSDGVLAVATSTGGMTNKLTGRIGDTPSLGAGFWAEEWEDETYSPLSASSSSSGIRSAENLLQQGGPALVLSETLKGLLAECFPNPTLYTPLPQTSSYTSYQPHLKTDKHIRSTALSGTGNGDSFLRLSAVRTASAITRYRPSTTLQTSVTEITGPQGSLQKSAGDRWRKTGEGEGGIIGIELNVIRDGKDSNQSQSGDEGGGKVKKFLSSEVVYDFNCGGMFRAWVTREGKAVVRVFREGDHDEGFLEREYPFEGREVDISGFGEKL